MTPIEVLGVTFLGGVFGVVFAVFSLATWEQAQRYESSETPRRLLVAVRFFDGLMFLSLLVGAGALIVYCAMVFADVPELTWRGPVPWDGLGNQV